MKDEVIRFRVTKAEKTMFEAAAAKRKLTLSNWFIALGKQQTACPKRIDPPSAHSIKEQAIVAEAMKRMSSKKAVAIKKAPTPMKGKKPFVCRLKQK